MTMWLPSLASGVRPIHRAIADAIGADIDSGRLRAGDRLPTHRALARALGVATPTVTHAYALAERWGLVSGEVGRGTFVRASRDAGVALALPNREPGLIDLSANFPAPLRGAEGRALAGSLEALARRADLSALLRDHDISGAGRALDVASRLLGRLGLGAPPERIVVTAGPQHAMTAVFAAVASPGDVVLCEALTYPGMKALASALRLTLVPLPLDAGGLDPDAFERACRRRRPKALYCTPTVQTPTASIMAEARRRRIAATAQRYGVVIVEDDDDSLVLERAPAPLASHAPGVGVFIADTNKCVAPGLRVAFVAAPEGLVRPIIDAVRATVFMTPPLMRELATLWLESGLADGLIAQRRAEVGARRSIALRALGRGFVCPRGAHHGWLALPSSVRADALAEAARGRGVVVAPSGVFAVPGGANEQGVQVCLGGVALRDRFEDGVARLAETLRTGGAG